jgi:hypothetical protein
LDLFGLLVGYFVLKSGLVGIIPGGGDGFLNSGKEFVPIGGAF